MPLDPENLTPAASLNRVRLVSGPKLTLPPHLEGRTAQEVLSAEAIRALVSETAAKYEVSIGDITNITSRIESWLASEQDAKRLTAHQVIREHALRLAALTAVLKLGEPPARSAREEWDESYWTHWSRIERIWLCGGLAHAELAAAAEQELARAGVTCAVKLAPNAQHAPLIGAARSARGEAPTAFVFDFGGTSVKRAVAGYEAGALVSMRLLTPLPLPRQTGDRSPQALGRIISEMIRSTGNASKGPIEVGVSIAAYVRGGHLLALPDTGYVDIRGIANLAAWLGEYVSRQEASAHVRIVHDGTASAISVTSSENTAAAITLGTYLGVGFTRRTADGLLPLARDFRLG